MDGMKKPPRPAPAVVEAGKPGLRQERLAIIKQLKKANRKAKRLNAARREREMAKARALVAEPTALNVAPPRKIDVVQGDDVRNLVEGEDV